MFCAKRQIRYWRFCCSSSKRSRFLKKRVKKKSGCGGCLAVLLVFTVMAGIAGVIFAKPAKEKVDNYRYPLEFTEEVEQYAAEFNLDPFLIYTVIHTESGFDPLAESNVGARGLMQMTEETFEWIKSKIAPEENLTFEDLYTPAVSIRFGSCFLSMCMERYGQDVSTAAAAYHSGWGTVDILLQDSGNTEDGIRLTSFPYDQMYNYVQKINRTYEAYLQIYAEAAE